ncbi:Double-stranded RNA-binding protein 6 [Sarracenia purpurea var. burkii]
MYKNQLQELAQRSCFNLPSYTCIREGPDHAPRFKAAVNFNGETFESPSFCTTLRQAEHSAAEVALNALSTRGPSHSLAARILDETGVYKNLLQEVSQRVAESLPIYTTFRSGVGHLPVFSCTVELAGVRFTGEMAKNKKQAEKNAAMAAWSSLKLLVQQSESSSSKKVYNDEQEHVAVSRALQNFLRKAKLFGVSFPIVFPIQNPNPLSAKPPPIRASKILPLICSKTALRSRPMVSTTNDGPICPRTASESQLVTTTANDISLPSPESPWVRPQKFHAAAGAAPYIPIRHFRPYHGIAPPVTIRNAIPVFSAPPPPQQLRPPPPPPSSIAPPVCVRQTVPVFAAPSLNVEEQHVSTAPPAPPAASPPHPPQLRPPPLPSNIAPPVCVRQTVPVFAAAPVKAVEQPVSTAPPAPPPAGSSVPTYKTEGAVEGEQRESVVIRDLQELKI